MMDGDQNCERCDKRPSWKAPAGWYVEHGTERCRVMPNSQREAHPECDECYFGTHIGSPSDAHADAPHRQV